MVDERCVGALDAISLTVHQRVSAVPAFPPPLGVNLPRPKIVVENRFRSAIIESPVGRHVP